MKEKYEFSLDNYELDEIVKLCGVEDENLTLISEQLHCDLIIRDNRLQIICFPKSYQLIEKIIVTLLSMIQSHHLINQRDVLYIINLGKSNQLDSFVIQESKPVGKTSHGKLIFPKTIGQSVLYQAMKDNDIVFASGPAGTGKTYLAVVYAVSMLKKGEVKKIVLTRPAVEAGENLGFLPGDLKEKVDPYLRPLYDALYDMLGKEQVEKLMEKEVIEIAPLAYMRGRTLEHAFIILDEAQNTTRSQMKMFLTRMGFYSKIVITGDITQIDLIKQKDSGLLNAKDLLEGIKGIGFVSLSSLDVVRHPLVQKIIERYEQVEALK